MNLPWDKSYFKACFYAIFTFICIYIAKNAIDGIIYTFVNLGDIYSFVMNIAKKICSVFSIIIAGFIIAYILKPVVEFMVLKTGMKKTTSVGVVFILLITVVCAGIFVTLYAVDYKELSRNIKNYSNNINNIYSEIKQFFESHNMNFIENIFESVKDVLYSYIKSAGKDFVNISKKIVSRGVTFLLSVVVAFYMLKDEEKIISRLKEYFCVFISEKWRTGIYGFIKDVDDVFSGYLRGQLTDGLIMASLISLGLSVIKVPFSVAIGLFSGFSNIIPYFGSIIGFCLSVGMALISGEPVRAVYAAVFLIILQQIDTVVIVPKVVGDSVKLSPVMIIISLAVAGKLFGITGMIFAVPAVAVIKLRLDKYCERRVGYGKTYRKGIEENRNSGKKSGEENRTC